MNPVDRKPLLWAVMSVAGGGKMALFVTGVPGTGKTEQLLRIIELFGITNPFVIETDRYRHRGSIRYDVTDRLLDQAIANSKNIVYENMNVSQWTREHIIKRLRDQHGYRVKIVLLWTSPTEAAKQRITRRRLTGKWVPPGRVRLCETRTPLEFFEACQCQAVGDEAVLLYNRPGAARELEKVATVSLGCAVETHGHWTVEWFLRTARLPRLANAEADKVLRPYKSQHHAT